MALLVSLFFLSFSALATNLSCSLSGLNDFHLQPTQTLNPWDSPKRFMFSEVANHSVTAATAYDGENAHILALPRWAQRNAYMPENTLSACTGTYTHMSTSGTRVHTHLSVT